MFSSSSEQLKVYPFTNGNMACRQGETNCERGDNLLSQVAVMLAMLLLFLFEVKPVMQLLLNVHKRIWS